MTDSELIARIQTCQLTLQECLAALWARQPTGGANNGKMEMPDLRFANLAAATAYHAECERREPGCWEIVESGWSYTVRRRKP